MSESVTVPAGLDKMTADEQRIFNDMRADDDGPAAAPAPAAAAEPEASPAPEIDLDDAPADDGKQKLVPHAQFHAANERRKAAEAKAAAAEQRAAVEAAKFAERLNLLTQAVAVSQPPAPVAPAVEVPDRDADPIGYFEAQLRIRDQQVAELRAIATGMQENGHRVQQATELRNWGAAQEHAFLAEEPSYSEAMTHLQNSFFRELAASGVTDPNAQREIMGQNVAQIAARARSEGANFAQRLFAMAEARGFAKKAAVPTLDATPALDQAERVAAGRESAVTIGSIGAAPPTRLSPEKIANMSDRDFGVLVGKLKGDPAALRRLMGE